MVGHAAKELLEQDSCYVVDDFDSPLMVMPISLVLHQRLYHRHVIIAVFSKKRKLILIKKPALNNESSLRWGLFSGPVRIGEAREDAALRLLGGFMTNVPMLLKQVDPFKPKYAARQIVSLFTARLSAPLYFCCDADRTQTIAVDADELEGLCMDLPDLMHPELLWLVNAGEFFNSVRFPGEIICREKRPK